ncbi:hypothetical protein F8388_009334 [Cannabis sativa]|uniref:Uncharacterized protein n=1 Tax=Cannabis sativa TaxID=3483 RepID=A0A7J6GKA9_CANSA|nr:hypothetical protein F8388_009334 [Cannabis sativa]KAF4393310.1 hypothetical protein G4B88_002044 [Cannabis sativa]
MDSFDFHGVAEEKTSSTSKEFYNRIISLAKLFRFAELCVALFLVMWIFNRLPLAVEISGGYFRQVSSFLTSPLFVFLLCNIIVVTIIANSGKLSDQNQIADDTESELYEKIVKNSRDCKKLKNDIVLSETEGTTVYEDKQVISEVNTTVVIKEAETDHFDPYSDFPKVYRRWKSEQFERECVVEEDRHHLQRSESEKCMEIVVSDREKHPIENLASHDKLSDDDFNRTVEAFIAKQLKFRRREHGGGGGGGCGVELQHGDLEYEKSEVSCSSQSTIKIING